MKQKTLARAGQIIGWLLTALILLCALLLGAAFVRICLAGDAPFTRERVAEALARLLPLFLLTLLVLVAGVVIQVVMAVRFGEKKGAVRGICLDKAPQILPHRQRILRLVLLCVALLLIVLGALNGSMRDVLEKAVRICTECIGLG